MKWGFNQITARIWLGGEIEGHDDIAMLSKLGISYIINCSEFPEIAAASFMTTFWPAPPKPDDGTPRTLVWFQSAGKFWLPLALNPEARVYVHCTYGLERSHAMVLYLLMLMGLALEDAWMLVSRHRPIDVIGVRYLAEAQLAAAAQTPVSGPANTVDLCKQ